MKNTQRLSLGALLLAVMLVLGYLESLIPAFRHSGREAGTFQLRADASRWSGWAAA